MTTYHESRGEYLMRKGMDPYEEVDLQAEKIIALEKEIERLQREVDALMPAAAEPVPMGGWQAQQEEIERLQDMLAGSRDVNAANVGRIERLRAALDRNVQERHRYKHIDAGHHCGWRVIAEAMIERSREALRDD